MSKLPEEMWFGTTDGLWPIHCWASEAHALVWLQEAGAERRRLWKAQVSQPVEFEVVAPKPYLKASVEELAP